METRKEEQLASRLSRYVDGNMTAADFAVPEIGELLEDIETVNVLKLGLGAGAVLDDEFSERLRRRVVAEAAKRRVFPVRWLALAAMFLILIIPAALYFTNSFLTTKRIAEEKRQLISTYNLQPMSAEHETDYILASFAPQQEERMDSVHHRWEEEKMEKTYEKYMRERGDRL